MGEPGAAAADDGVMGRDRRQLRGADHSGDHQHPVDLPVLSVLLPPAGRADRCRTGRRIYVLPDLPAHRHAA